MKISKTPFILMISLFTNFINSTAFANDRSGSKMCNEIGNYIYQHASFNDDTNLDYVLLNAPSLDIRQKIMEKYFPNTQTTLNTIEQYIETPRPPLLLSRDKIKSRVYKGTTSFLDGSTEFGSYITYIVGLLKYADIPVLKALKISEPLYKADSYITGSQLLSSTWIEVSMDARYSEAVLKLVRKLNIDFYSFIASPRGLYEDLLRSFLETGVKNRNEAIRMTWNILGLYGSQGAAIGAFANWYDFGNHGFSFGLTYLSYLISAMDSLSLEKLGHLYSVPSQFQTQCAIGKPYHFWMGAFLAFKMRLEGSSIGDSIVGSYQLSEMYEYYAVTNGRWKGTSCRSTFLVNSKLDSIDLNSIRLSLLLHGAGSYFGATFDQPSPPSVDLDFILGEALDKSQEPSFVWISNKIKFNKTEIFNPFERHRNLRKMTSSEYIFKSVTGLD